MRGKLIKGFFFGNYFYGVCAVALMIEATLQQQFPFNSLTFYLYSFSATVLYYTRAYITDKPPLNPNPRTEWYWRNRKAIFYSQLALAAICVAYLVDLFIVHRQFILAISIKEWVLLAIFPLVAALYYGRVKLRNIGWLKPFLIGFVWAGLVNIYPILFYNFQHHTHILPDAIGLFLFIKNFMFITVLCILFDIKDYAADHNRQLKTFVVKAGLRKTIFFIVIPLCVAGLTSFVFYAGNRNFSVEKILLNTIPFLCLIAVAWSLQTRKSIFYYLAVIDGLMLLKAFCGSMAMLYF